MRRAPLFLAALLAGCTVGPSYHPADMAVPAQFAGPQAPGAAVDPAHWWTRFGDPELTALVTRALSGDPDIALAASRIREARLQEIAARANGRPTVNADASVSRVEFSKNAGFSSLARLFSGGGNGPSTSGVALPGSGITTFALGFDSAWELDLFGGARRGVEAAGARTEAAEWSQRDAAVSVAGEVAQAYLALRADQAQVAVIEAQLQRERGALTIAGHVAQVGLVPPIDVTRQRSQITSTEARLAPIRADIAIRRHALAILLGQPPAALDAELAAPAVLLIEAPQIPAGLPSDLLRRRPDVREAERTLAAATADIGVAVADQYPRFNLTGVAQLISTALSTLFSGNSLQLTGTGAAQFPVLDWGRRRAAVDLRKEARDRAYLQYRTAVLQALRDVEDALVRIDAERSRRAPLASAVADAEESEHAIAAQYRTGFVAQDALLNAQAQTLAAREQLTLGDAQARQQTVALFKALGGGWEDAAPAR